MRPHVFDTMGTTVSVMLPAGASLEGIERVFADADERFSLYRSTSEASRLARDELTLTQTSAEFREVYVVANDWRIATGGAFTCHRPDGVIDLSGVVKAWAMARAESLLRSRGIESWCLNVGGDVTASGRDWSVGIVDPADRGLLLTTILLDPSRSAIATSGSAERGDHIWRTGDPGEARFTQVSVAAPDIVMADVLATAIVSAGPDGLDAIAEAWPIDVLAVLDDGGLLATPGMRGSIERFRAVA